MPRRAGCLVAATAPAMFNGAGSNYVIRTPTGTLYVVYIDTGSDVAFRKSDDNGISWSNPTIIFAGVVVALSVWYDRWSDITAGLIHIAYQESTTDDTLYRTINTESSDALSTQTVIFAGASTAGGGHLSITRSRGGNVYCKTVIDAGVEGGFFRLPNANVPNGAWDAARTINEALATTDQIILVPGFAADNQDIMAIWIDSSANGLSRQIYDDSANSWAETAIIADGGVVEGIATTAWPHFDAAVDITNSRIIVVCWTAVDTANADLRCFTVTESAITETSTNVVLNSTDDQGMVAIAVNEDDADHWVVFYCGASGGGETFQTSLNIYAKGTKDAGATWSPETQITQAAHNMRMILSSPRCPDGRWGLVYFEDLAIDELVCVATLTQPHATYAIGV